MLFKFIGYIPSNSSSTLPLRISHSPCCASGWVLVSGSISNSQGGEFPNQHTHILRQSWHFTETKTTTTVLFCSCCHCCRLFSALLSSPSCWLWSGPCSLPAQLSPLPPRYICLNELNERVSKGEREREHSRVQDGRGEGEGSSFHIVVVERKMGGESCGSAECFHFDQCYTQLFPPSYNMDNVKVLQHFWNLFSTPAQWCLQHLDSRLRQLGMVFTLTWPTRRHMLFNLTWMNNLCSKNISAAANEYFH